MSAVSPLTLNRLSLYLRCLQELEAHGIERVSSTELADRYQLSASQIRKDLAQFGEFGIAASATSSRHLQAPAPSSISTTAGLSASASAHRHRAGPLPGFNGRLPGGGPQIDPAKVGRRLGALRVEPPDRLRRWCAAGAHRRRRSPPPRLGTRAGGAGAARCSTRPHGSAPAAACG